MNLQTNHNGQATWPHNDQTLAFYCLPPSSPDTPENKIPVSKKKSILANFESAQLKNSLCRLLLSVLHQTPKFDRSFPPFPPISLNLVDLNKNNPTFKF